MSVDNAQRELKDPGERSRRQQIEQLNDIREQIADIRTEGMVDLSKRQRQQAVFGFTREYVRLLQPYISDGELQSDEQPAIWDEKPYRFTVQPPDPSSKSILSQTDPWDKPPQPKQYQLTGVRQFATLPDEPTVTFSFTSKNGEQKAMAADATPPERVVSEVVGDLDTFRRRVGLGLQLEDQSEVLEL